MTALFYTLLCIFVFVSAITCLVILVQEAKNVGLGASFGGGDTSDSLFGTSTAQVLKTFTGYVAIIFLSLCVILSLLTSKMGRMSVPMPTEIESPAE